MATKPSIVPTWNTGGANNTAPTAPKIVLGFENGERAASSYFNNRMKWYGEWLQYLSDGAFTGNHTFGGTVGITGAVTCSSTLGVTGAVTLSSTLAVTGVATFTAAPVFSAGAAAAVNQHFTVSGTGRYKHGDTELMFAASAFSRTATAASYGSGAIPELNIYEWYFSAGTTPIIAPVQLEVGKRIKSIVWSYPATGASVVLALKKRLAGATTTINTTTETSGTSVTRSSINYTIESGAQVWLEVNASSGTQFASAIVTYDHP